MKRLPQKFTKQRHQFEQICRSENTAIYMQHINGRQKSFEVIIIRVANRTLVKSNGKMKWVDCEPYECYPSSDSWGLYGFTYSTEEDAKAKYDLLNDPAFKIPTPPHYPIRVRGRDGILPERVLTSGSVRTADGIEPVASRGEQND
jgi:hypothetical protein